MANLLGYLPHQGLRSHREAIVTWLSPLGVTADPDELFITHGGQHAISIALSLTIAPGDIIFTERFTYSGMIALSTQHEYRMHGVGRASIPGDAG